MVEVRDAAVGECDRGGESAMMFDYAKEFYAMDSPAFIVGRRTGAREEGVREQVEGSQRYLNGRLDTSSAESYCD